MKIWLIQIGEPLPLNEGIRPMRTALLARELGSRGHEVTWWTSRFDHHTKKFLDTPDNYELYPGVRVKFMRATGYKKNLSPMRFLDHRILAQVFKVQSRLSEKPDLILASWPSYDLAAAAVDYAKTRSIPIVLDIRDEWPSLFVKKVPEKLQPAAKLALWNEFRIAKKALKNATALTSMMEDLLEWAQDFGERGDRDKDRVFYLGINDFSKVELKPAPTINGIKEKANGRKIITYIGTFGDFNDPTKVIEALKTDSGEDEYFFVFGGDGPLKAKSENLAAGIENIAFPGWLDQNQMLQLLKISSFGLCPTPIRRKALPNKSFLYMAHGLPIINFFDGDLKRLVDEHGLGVNLAPGEERKVLKKLRDLKISTNESLNKWFDEHYIYSRFSSYLVNINSSF